MPNNDTFLSRAIADGRGWKWAEAAMSFTQARTVGNPNLATYSGSPVEAIERATSGISQVCRQPAPEESGIT